MDWSAEKVPWLSFASLVSAIYYRPLVWLTLAVIAGVKLPVALAIPQVALLVCLTSALIAAYALRRKEQPLCAGVCVALAAVFFGAYLAHVALPPVHDSLSRLATRKSEPIAVRCLITSAAVWRPNPNHRSSDPNSQAWLTSWEVYCEQLRDGRHWKPISSHCTLTVEGRIDRLLPGDVAEVMGSFRRISPATNPGAFDLAKHFLHDGQFISLSTKSPEQITVIESSWRMPLSRLRAWLVKQVDRSLNRWVGWSQSPLAAALVFGQREQVEWEDQQELMATGTLHMLSISGLHVEIVAATVLLLSSPFAWRNATLLVMLVCICGAYAMLAGSNPPVLRAVIVVAVFALARTLGRPARLSNTLGLAALILLTMRVANIDNIGVQLSFLAVGTIGVFVLDSRRETEHRSAIQGIVEQSLNRFNRWTLKWFRSIKQTWHLSLWVWLVTTPLVWANFHVISPVAIPLNVLIALPLTVSLISGLICGLFGWLVPVGWLSGTICGASLGLISWLVGLSARVPLGHIWLPAPPAWWLAIFYVTLASWLLVWGQSRNRGLLIVLCLWMGVGILPHAFGPRGLWGSTVLENSERQTDAPSADGLRCTFLDVGHGTSVIIEMPTGEVWLYDAGHMGAADRSHQEIAAALWHVPTARIARLLISHADTDHFNATRGLDKRFKIDRLASTSYFWKSSDRDVLALQKELGDSVPRESFHAGMSGKCGAVQYHVLHPPTGQTVESDNASSLCLLIEYAGKRILLPGDLEGSGLLALTQLPPRPCHVLMAPHHGSLTLDPSELLAWCRPEWTVISGNHRAARDEVLKQYSTADSQLAITFRDGAIQIRIDPSGGLTAWHWKADKWERFAE